MTKKEKKKQLNKNCPHCLFSKEFCLCLEDKSKIKLPLRLIFVMNKSEFFKLSNSARLYLLNCHPCEIRVRGLKNSPFNYEGFSKSLESSENYLLYPHEDSKKVELSNLLKQSTKPLNLIVPDGNWSQAAKIAHKLKSKGNITPIALKNPPKSLYQLRKNPNLERVSTFEATFCALQKSLQEEDSSKLKKSFQQFVINVLKLRGKIPRKTS